MADMSMPNGIGYNLGNLDLATQQAQIDQRRKLMLAMVLKSMQENPTQMAGNIAIRQSPLAGIAQALSGYVGNKGLQDANDQESDLVKSSQQKASDAMTALMGATQAKPGTPTTMQEEGSTFNPEERGVTTTPGTPPGMDVGGFSKAFSAAQGAGINPAILSSMLTNFQRNQMLSRNPETAGFVPGMDQAPPSVTPGDPSLGGTKITMPAGMPNQGGAGGGMYGVPGSAVGLTLSGDPAMEKLGAMIAKNAEPLNLRSGGTAARVLPSGQVAPTYTAPGPTPAGAEIKYDAQGNATMSQMKGASDVLTKDEAIKAGFKSVTMKADDGTETQGYLGAGGVFSPFKLAGAPSAPSAPPSAPNVMNMQTAPLTPAQQAYAAANPAPGVSGPNFNRSQSPAAHAEATGMAGNLVKQSEATDEGAKIATQGLARVQTMQNLLPAFEPGAGAEVRMKAANWAATAGASEALVKKIAGGDLSAMQEFQKLAFGNSIEQLRSLVGPGQRISQLEMITNYQQSPNPSLQREANQAMLQFQGGTYKWLQDKQQMAEQWRAPAAQGGKGTYTGFESWWNRNHPLSGADLNGTPYIPSADQLQTQFQSVAKPARVSGGVDTATGVPQPSKVMKFDAQGNLL